MPTSRNLQSTQVGQEQEQMMNYLLDLNVKQLISSPSYN